MKIIYNINKATLVITLILYLTVILGMYAQVVLGIVQIISALILFNFWNILSDNSKKQLNIYWSIVLIYGLGWLFDWNSLNIPYLFICYLFVIPMLISFYLFYIIDSIKNI